jgi:hypothetical protein
MKNGRGWMIYSVVSTVIAVAQFLTSAFYTSTHQLATPPETKEPPRTPGWHTVDVFYGSNDLLNIPDNNIWTSQCKQDLIVSTLLHNKTNGYFVDLAANDAVEWSNTLALERLFQWRGEWTV